MFCSGAATLSNKVAFSSVQGLTVTVARTLLPCVTVNVSDGWLASVLLVAVQFAAATQTDAV